MAFFYEMWANYNYLLIANTIQMSAFFIIISKTGDETYDKWITEIWWVVWIIGVFNTLLFFFFMGTGLYLYIFFDGIVQYFSVSIFVFEIWNRGLLLVSYTVFLICESTKNFYTYERYE